MQLRSTFSIVLLFGSISLHAQTVPAPSNVEIRITDTSGAGIPDADVTAKPEIGPTISTKTDGSGIAALSLPPGNYHVSALARAFATTTTELDFPEGAQIRTTLTLKLGLAVCGPCMDVQEPKIPILPIPAPPLIATIPEFPLTGQFHLRPVKFRR
jgi:hypothetical protein